MLAGPMDEGERSFVRFLTRTLFPLWLLFGCGLLAYALLSR